MGYAGTRDSRDRRDSRDSRDTRASRDRRGYTGYRGPEGPEGYEGSLRITGTTRDAASVHGTMLKAIFLHIKRASKHFE